MDTSKLRSDLSRAFFAYKSVLNGQNPVISISTHEYKKAKAAVIVGSGLLPVLLKSEVYKAAIRLTNSNKKLPVLAASSVMFGVGIPLCGFAGWCLV
jgi:hypothetical protein